MSIKTITIHEYCPSELPSDAACLYVTNATQNRRVEHSIHMATNTPHARMTLFASGYSDVAAVVQDWLCGMDFSDKDVMLHIYSDCNSVSAMDVAALIRIILPKVKMDHIDGQIIPGFKVYCEAMFGPSSSEQEASHA